MKYIRFFNIFILLILTQVLSAQEKQLKVVTTLSSYASITKFIGGKYVDVQYIVPGNQDAHFVRPRPSFARMMQQADLFISTGLDLELWVPSLMNMAHNEKIRSGQIGYVAAAQAVRLLDKPAAVSRSEGDMHIYGNPHIHTSPLNAIDIAVNIVTGLQKNDSRHSKFYEQRLEKFRRQIYLRLFGDKLVKLMGGEILHRLAIGGNLISFLKKKSFRGEKMYDMLGGWMKEAEIFRNKKIVTYHKNLIYFASLFGLKVSDFVEPKPGIPPSPRHVQQLIDRMRSENIRVILAANYFSKEKVMEVAEKVDARAVIVPMSVEGNADAGAYFRLVDRWVSSLAEAFKSLSGVEE